MQTHQLQRTHSNKKKKRVGRGGKRGTYSGRGIKGQKARAGRKIRPQMRDTIKKIPKKRGYGKNRRRGVHDSRIKPVVINVSTLERIFEDGDTVTPQALVKLRLISPKRHVSRGVKILSNGILRKKLSLSGCSVSKTAQKKIEKAGGRVMPPHA